MRAEPTRLSRTRRFASVCALAACMAWPAQAQPSAAGSVAPPVRADVALSGSVLAARNVTDHAACQSECQRTPGCTGYSFNRAAKANCSLLGGALTDVAVVGAVSCRMPCDAERKTALPPRPPVATLRMPPPATVGAPVLPVNPPPRAQLLPLQPPPATPATLGATASTSSASTGAGLPPSTNLPPCVPGRVSVAGSCSSAAVPATPAAPLAPSTITLLPTSDNTIGSSGVDPAPERTVHPSNYWSAAPGIGMGCNQLMYSGGQFISCARGLMRFNLAPLAGKTIQSAVLRLTASAVGSGPYKDAWYVAASASPWNAGTVTWLNYGELTHTASISTLEPPAQLGQVVNLDQTATVRNWLTGAYTNNGFVMALTRETLHNCGCNSQNHFEFHSREDAQGRGPQLIVTYQ